jgi:hypothetical protein
LEARLKPLFWKLLSSLYYPAAEDNASFDEMDSDGEPTTSMDDEEQDLEDMDENDEHCGCSGDSKKKKALSSDARVALASGALVLPYNNQFPLPPVVTCKGGCSDDVYCRLVFLF